MKSNDKKCGCIIDNGQIKFCKLHESAELLFRNLDDLLFCVEDWQLGDYSPLMDEIFDSRHALEETGLPRRRKEKL
jgi:hypothetical protein